MKMPVTGAGILLAIFAASCAAPPSFTSPSILVPTAASVTPVKEGVLHTMAAITNVDMTRLNEISFTGNWEGPAIGQRVHTLLRSDWPPQLNTAAEIENWINTTWLIAELKDVSGQRIAFGAVHIFSLTGGAGGTMQASIILSDKPVTGVWWQ